jgi:hypothetical protein
MLLLLWEHKQINLYIYCNICNTFQLTQNIFALGLVCDSKFEDYLKNKLDLNLINRLNESNKFRKRQLLSIINYINKLITAFKHKYRQTLIYKTYYEELTSASVKNYGLEYSHNLLINKVYLSLKGYCLNNNVHIKQYYYLDNKRVSHINIPKFKSILPPKSLGMEIVKLYVKYLFFSRFEYYSKVYPYLNLDLHKGFVNDYHIRLLSNLKYIPPIYYEGL